MFAPIARTNDMHVCPMQTPAVVPVPHVGGPVLPPGAPTVLAGGMPVATVGSMAICTGSPAPDVLTLGSFTVLAAGQPVIRVGDVSAHGGSVIVGLPTVMVGDSGGAGGAAGATMSAAKAAGLAFAQRNCGNQAAQQALQRAQPPAPTGPAWIEIEIVDLDGKPIAYQEVRVTDAGGAVHSRYCDTKGLIRIDGIRAGQCQVTLPDLDGSSWEPA